MELREKVLNALDEIRPFLAADGGDISLIDIENDKAESPTTRCMRWLFC